MPRRTTTGFALGALAMVPIAAIGATGDVARQGYLPGGGTAGSAVEGSAFSPDGRYLLMASSAPLSGRSTGAVGQLFMRDLRSGQAVLVSATASGQPANLRVDDDAAAPPYGASLDGRYVVFSSSATNLVVPDANGSSVDVFRKDTMTGRISIVSRDSRGAQPVGGVVGQPSISADGMRVAFTSGPAPLVAADTNGVPDVYVADLRARTLTLASRSASGAQSPTAVGHPSISADGRTVAFEGDARASVLAPGDSDGHGDVYVARPAARTITVASVPGTGGADNGESSLPSLSGDGSRVAFRSAATLVPGATGRAYVRDLDAGTTTRASDGATTGRPAMAVDGSRMAFVDGNDAYVRTLATDGLYRVSRTPGGAAPAAPSSRPAVSSASGLAAFTYADGSPARADTWTTDIGDGDVPAPALTARATTNGRRVTVAGTATSPAGVTAVMVGRRMARLGDGGRYSVSYVAPIGSGEVTVRAMSGAGATATRSVPVTRDARGRSASPGAPRPQALRVGVARPWARTAFTLPVRASWRAELRKRTPGPARAGAFRLISHRAGPARTGRVTARLRIPPRLAPGTYQVRVLISSARGLGTTARTITVP